MPTSLSNASNVINDEYVEISPLPAIRTSSPSPESKARKHNNTDAAGRVSPSTNSSFRGMQSPSVNLSEDIFPSEAAHASATMRLHRSMIAPARASITTKSSNRSVLEEHKRTPSKVTPSMLRAAKGNPVAMQTLLSSELRSHCHTTDSDSPSRATNTIHGVQRGMYTSMAHGDTSSMVQSSRPPLGSGEGLSALASLANSSAKMLKFPPILRKEVSPGLTDETKRCSWQVLQACLQIFSNSLLHVEKR